MRRSADTKGRGRFSEMRRGPSHRRARSASAALENFVRRPQKTFSTVSARRGDNERFVTLIDTDALPPFRDQQTILDFAIAPAELRSRVICRPPLHCGTFKPETA